MDGMSNCMSCLLDLSVSMDQQCYHFVLQSNSLPGHVKINVTRENLFEDSFQQVSFHYLVQSSWK